MELRDYFKSVRKASAYPSLRALLGLGWGVLVALGILAVLGSAASCADPSMASDRRPSRKVTIEEAIGARQPRKATFDPVEYMAFDGVGTSEIEGELLMRMRSEPPRPVPDWNVFLYPMTSVTRETLKRQIIGGEQLEPIDLKSGVYRRSASTQADGWFQFAGLPAGEYLVVAGAAEYDTEISWSTITLAAGETKRVVLTR